MPRNAAANCSANTGALNGGRLTGPAGGWSNTPARSPRSTSSIVRVTTSPKYARRRFPSGLRYSQCATVTVFLIVLAGKASHLLHRVRVGDAHDGLDERLDPAGAVLRLAPRLRLQLFLVV